VAIPFPNNVTFDIYRGFAVSSPIPPGDPDVPGVQGHIRHHVKNGKFGYRNIIFWTNVLHVALGTDIRSGYNSQLNTIDPQKSDTVVIKDFPIQGKTTAFQVVMVTRSGRGSDLDHLKVYLDKAGIPSGPQCCLATVPDTLNVTFTAPPTDTCNCFNGLAFQIFRNPGTNIFVGSASNFMTCGNALDLSIRCRNSVHGVQGLRLSLICGLGQSVNIDADPTSICSPLHATFTPPNGLQMSNCCVAGGQLVISVTQ
jgi:hypothetical protein